MPIRFPSVRMDHVDDPHDLIVNSLMRPREGPRSVSRSSSGWTAIVGGHVPARPDTIRIVRERFLDGRGLVAVEYEDEDDRAWFMVFGITRSDADGWRMAGASGGGRSEPQSSVPWANLGGWIDGPAAYAGGRVHGATVRRVRLGAADGRTADDDVGDSGIALVIANGSFPQPWTVELYDADGALVGTHPFHRGRPRPTNRREHGPPAR
jgi:hypothetical protein